MWGLQPPPIPRVESWKYRQCLNFWSQFSVKNCWRSKLSPAHPFPYELTPTQIPPFITSRIDIRPSLVSLTSTENSRKVYYCISHRYLGSSLLPRQNIWMVLKRPDKHNLKRENTKRLCHLNFIYYKTSPSLRSTGHYSHSSRAFFPPAVERELTCE